MRRSTFAKKPVFRGVGGDLGLARFRFWAGAVGRVYAVGFGSRFPLTACAVLRVGRVLSGVGALCVVPFFVDELEECGLSGDAAGEGVGGLRGLGMVPAVTCGSHLRRGFGGPVALGRDFLLASGVDEFARGWLRWHVGSS